LIKLKLRQLIVERSGVLDDNVADPGDSSAGDSTKHPRHRSGCTCRTCITVKHRLDTLLTRKKQLHGIQNDDDIYDRDEGDGACLSEREGSINKGCVKKGERSAGEIDLNCRPNLDEDMQVDI